MNSKTNKKPFKNPGQLRAYLALTWYAFRAQTRNPATFFFGFIFPIVFISIFGLIGGNGSKVNIGIPTNSDQTNPVVQVLKKQSFVTTVTGNEDDLQKQLIQGKIGGIVKVQRQIGNRLFDVVVTTTH